MAYSDLSGYLNKKYETLIKTFFWANQYFKYVDDLCFQNFWDVLEEKGFRVEEEVWQLIV